MLFRFEPYLWSNSHVLERLCLELEVRLLSNEFSLKKVINEIILLFKVISIESYVYWTVHHCDS